MIIPDEAVTPPAPVEVVVRPAATVGGAAVQQTAGGGAAPVQTVGRAHLRQVGGSASQEAS
jgi:hypothetical protein